MKMLEGSTLLNPRVEFTEREMEWICYAVSMIPRENIKDTEYEFYKHLSQNLDRFLSVEFAPESEKEFMLGNRDALEDCIKYYKSRIKEFERFGEGGLLDDYRAILKEREEWLQSLSPSENSN